MEAGTGSTEVRRPEPPTRAPWQWGRWPGAPRLTEGGNPDFSSSGLDFSFRSLHGILGYPQNRAAITMA